MGGYRNLLLVLLNIPFALVGVVVEGGISFSPKTVKDSQQTGMFLINPRSDEFDDRDVMPRLGLVTHLERMAPQVGLEPTTLRLTAGCSAIELLRSVGSAVPSGRAVLVPSFYTSSHSDGSKSGTLAQEVLLCSRTPASLQFDSDLALPRSAIPVAHAH
jgi:hypothetical protein